MKRRAAAIGLGLCFLAGGFAAAPAAWAQGGAAYFLIVGGLGGEPDYEQRFNSYVRDLQQICQATSGDPSRVIALSGKGATRQAIQAALENLARTTTPADSLAVFLIGHGSYDGVDYKFNIPGPDLSAEQFKSLLDRIPAGRQLVMNATSSSGVCAEQWAKDNRIVVTATKSGTERNATVFARYWIEALRDPSADTDKNDTISALEAFRYAEEKVKKFYADEKRLATEHPRMEGKQAGTFILARLGTAAAAASDPAKRKLLAQRETLEQQIDVLKYRKASLPPEEYKKELERLLVELAKVDDAIEGPAGK